MTGRTHAAIVLARGLGTRMRRDDHAALDRAQMAAAAAGLKAMMPDARGRPFLDHILTSLADAAVTDVCLVVAPDHAGIRAHYETHRPRRVRLSWVVQPEPRGTADAMLAAEGWAAGRDVLALNADNLYPVAAIDALAALGGPGLVAFDADGLITEGNITADRLAAFSILDIRADGTLAGITEKPGAAPFRAAGAPRWVSMNLWRFDTTIFVACRAVPLSPRGELELPLAVAFAVQHGAILRVVTMRAGVLDLSQRSDVAGVAARLADREVAP